MHDSFLAHACIEGVNDESCLSVTRLITSIAIKLPTRSCCHTQMLKHRYHLLFASFGEKLRKSAVEIVVFFLCWHMDTPTNHIQVPCMSCWQQCHSLVTPIELSATQHDNA